LLMHAIIKMFNRSKIKMNKNSNNILTSLRVATLVVMAGIFASGAYYVPVVRADRFQDQINALNAENGQKAEVQGQLGSEAASLGEAITKLQSEISGMQAKINDNEAKMAQLQEQIKAAEAELARQRVLLGETIKAMYLEGDITTVEMLATSKDLSDFFDKQQYRESVQNKIKTTLDKINQLKRDLNTQKETVSRILAEQKALQAQLSSQQAEKNRILSLNQAEQAGLESQIKANKAKMASLRAEQLAANNRAISSGAVKITSSGSCGGGYPNSDRGAWGDNYGCNYPLDNTVDRWLMYNRECVSYTAWKVNASGRFMPSGWGNANNWDNAARRAGYAVDGSPRPGDVAVAEAGGMYGGVGHVMYVESVSGGTIHVSQFNFGGPGKYSEMNVSASGLSFIHF
jgi:peptidoglycan DL-endopeptidase CwlO